MEKLLKLIYEKLLELGYEVYEAEKVKKGAVLPYITFKVLNGTPTALNFQLEDYILEVDIWDVGSDSILVEQITDKISILLNRALFYKENVLQAKAYLIGRLRLDDERSEINRRQLRFQVRAYILINDKEEIL